MRSAGVDAIGDTFGIRSRPMVSAMAGFAVVYLTVTIFSGLDIVGVMPWLGLLGAFVLFLVAGAAVLLIPDDPLSVRVALVVAVLTATAASVALTSLPAPPTHVMQTGPPIGASVIVLAFLAVRGRPVAAWLASAVISVVTVGWSVTVGMGAAWGLAITLPGYAIMIMGSLFSVMLRPMTRQIYGLRASTEHRIAAEAAVAAATAVRTSRLEAFDERARPVLQSIVDRHDFAAGEVDTARYLEAQLRDGIRAPGLDTADVRDAAWRARRRGVEVILLDDGALDGLPDCRGEGIRASLVAQVAMVLDQAPDGRVTVRIAPPGRAVVATLAVDTSARHERIEFASDAPVPSRSVIPQGVGTNDPVNPDPR